MSTPANSAFPYVIVAEEEECRTNPAGNGYEGTTSVSVDDDTCISWTAVENDDIAASLAVDNVAKAKNYCRKLADSPHSKRNGPSCVVHGANKIQMEKDCRIAFCGKLILSSSER